MKDIKEALGIIDDDIWYYKFLPNQNIIEEIAKIQAFKKSFIYSDTFLELNGTKFQFQFINYGETQLVYVVTIDNSKKYTILVNQPATEYGVGKTEFINLNRLNQLDPDVVIKPISYFSNNDHELYITPYYYQARCIGVETTNWGIWIPEPDSHFKNFNNDEKRIINSTMVAMLINLYDEENNKGIAKTRLDGGDFMLLKGFEEDNITFENISNHIKLIAARELTSISLDDYIDRIRLELSKNDLGENELIITGKKLREPLTIEEVETGIELGLALRNKKSQNNNVEKIIVKEKIIGDNNHE